LHFLFVIVLLSTFAAPAAPSPAFAGPPEQAARAVLDAVAADRLRIRTHLERVERELRARDASSLAPAAREARARALDELLAYARRGVFPRNTRHPGERMPYFIDDEGRACAMAHLIQASGAAALAETVRARENNARVAAMTTELGPWLAENGLTAAEAARIQPEYCSCGDVYNPVCAEVHRVGESVPEKRTFLNECIAKTCGDTTVLHSGECTPDDELAEPSCGEGVCTGEPSGWCSLGLAPGRVAFGSAPAFGAGMLAILVVLLRRARRRAR
jgi:hypothetical protein